jgi:hypothetical protein
METCYIDADILGFSIRVMVAVRLGTGDPRGKRVAVADKRGANAALPLGALFGDIPRTLRI